MTSLDLLNKLALPTVRIMDGEDNFATLRFDDQDSAEGVYKTLRALFYANNPRDGYLVDLSVNGQIVSEVDSLPQWQKRD